MARLYLYKLKEYDKALKIYKAILAYYPSRQDKARLAQVRIGDVYREKGEFAKAKKIYTRVEKMTIRNMGLKEAFLRQGVYFQEVETYLKQNRLEAALDKLREWERAFPLSKVSGELPLLYSYYFFRKGDYERVVDEVNDLIKMNPQTSFLPDAELLMAGAYFHLGKKEEAGSIYRKIMKEYPDSSFSREARRAYSLRSQLAVY